MFGVLEIDLCVHLDILVVSPRMHFLALTTRSQLWKVLKKKDFAALSDAHSSSGQQLSENHREKVET